ncbi:MAG: hypothetical protein ACRC7N_14155 [Clostridium sp.]
MEKLEWQEPEIKDLLVSETEASSCDGVNQDGFWHGTQWVHPHYS